MLLIINVCAVPGEQRPGQELPLHRFPQLPGSPRGLLIAANAKWNHSLEFEIVLVVLSSRCVMRLRLSSP